MVMFNFKKRLSSMMKVDFRRMFTMPIYYLLVGISFIIPILILVMTTLMVGTESTDPVTGEVTIMEPIFTNVWQAIGSVSNTNQAGMSLDLTTMCNINMMFFAIAVLVCIFVSEDFKSGYCKNLFTVRSNKVDYVISKTLVGFVGGASMIIAYFIGALIGGAIAKLSFELIDVNITNIIMSMISKLFLVLIFSSIFLLASVIGKAKTWLSIIVSIGISMLMFTMIPMISPLDSTIINVVLCLVGGLLFSIGLGIISNTILKKTRLV